MPKRPSQRLRAVLFDWDGTLADSAEATYRCYVRVFGWFGIPFDRARFVETYSPDWYRTYAALGIRQDDWLEADQRWLACYHREPVELVPGARRAIERLVQAELRLGLVTSGTRERVLGELTALGLSDVFEIAVCAEDVRKRKPAPDPLLRALERLRLPPQQSVYLGDSPEDVEMARAANVFAVGIPGGFPNREQLETSGPDLMVSDLAAALDWILTCERPGAPQI